MGEYEPLRQEKKTELKKTYDNLKDARWFFVQKKDGTKIGYVAHFLATGETELGYFIVPDERGKGYVSETIEIMVDYVFLSRDVVRIQAKADPENVASWKALEKVGFKGGCPEKGFLLQREMERRLHLQYSERRMERTEGSYKDSLIVR
jgi:RimJ/RimL family protein N-acetyltransferase